MSIVAPSEQGLLFSFRICVVTLPLDFVIFVFFIEYHLGMDIIVNNFLTSTVLQIISPRSSYSMTFFIVMEKRIFMDGVRS